MSQVHSAETQRAALQFETTRLMQNRSQGTGSQNYSRVNQYNSAQQTNVQTPAPEVGIMARVTPRVNLATVTYPVVLATDGQRQLGTTGDHIAYNFPGGGPIDQFSILLAFKEQILKPSAKHIAVFSRINCLKAISFDAEAARQALMKKLRFAGIAFVGAEPGNGDGTPSMLASVIGGSHTVMTRHVEHDSKRLTTGAMVRWTLPIDIFGPTRPVTYYGYSGEGVFAELEEVNLEKDEETLRAINDTDEKFKEREYMREREIGIVICDNGRGSVDIRLK